MYECNFLCLSINEMYHMICSVILSVDIYVFIFIHWSLFSIVNLYDSERSRLVSDYGIVLIEGGIVIYL